MGFARLAEAPVRTFAGKTEKDKLSPLERIFCSSIGGALATWNQPIEVIRVEVRRSRKLTSDAIAVEVGLGAPQVEANDHEHGCLYLQGKWHQGPVSWCEPSHSAGHLADGTWEGRTAVTNRRFAWFRSPTRCAIGSARASRGAVPRAATLRRCDRRPLPARVVSSTTWICRWVPGHIM